MTRISWTALALHDLQDISVFLETRSTLATANRVCRSIYNSVQQLRNFPLMGKAGLEENTRELVVSGFPAYVIAYRIAQPGSIEVLRIWHPAQERVRD